MAKGTYPFAREYVPFDLRRTTDFVRNIEQFPAIVILRYSEAYGHTFRPPTIAGDNPRWHWTRVNGSEWQDAWQRFGFALNSETYAAPANHPLNTSFLVALPFWFLLILSALLAIPRLTRRVQPRQAALPPGVARAVGMICARRRTNVRSAGRFLPERRDAGIPEFVKPNPSAAASYS